MKKVIPLDVWEPVPDEPGMTRYAYGRQAIDVFNDLRQHLMEIDFLPDEYFQLHLGWENRSIPKGAWFSLEVDWGSSEGIYIDMFLFWQEGDVSRRERFITGKTLGESGEDMDRMFLIASAIRQSFA